jgi:hypothetical protein
MKILRGTTLKCIEKTKGTELSVVWEGMEHWETPKRQFLNKVAKFSEQQTKETLDLILDESWRVNIAK